MVARWWECACLPPQMSTDNGTRATIKAHPSQPRLPRPYGILGPRLRLMPIGGPLWSPAVPHLALYPCEITLTPGNHWYGEYLRFIICVSFSNRLLKFFVEVLSGLQQAQPFLGCFHCTLPPVGAGDWPNHLGACCQAFPYSSFRDFLSIVPGPYCGHHLNKLCHISFILYGRPPVNEIIRCRTFGPAPCRIFSFLPLGNWPSTT